MSSSKSVHVSEAVLEAVVDALFARGPLTRGQIMADTGLSRPSVSGAVTDLLASGRAEEATLEPASGRGRPSTTIRLSRRRAHSIGLEIGRGHVAMAITDASHAVVTTEALDVDHGLSLVERTMITLDIVERSASSNGIDIGDLHRVAVGTPGPRLGDASHPAVDFSLARLERERAVVADVVAQRLGAPVTVGNNTRFTALGEADRRAGTSAAAGDLVYLRVDEGIGGGIVESGEIASGSWGAAGEMGHVSIDPSGERCPCGGRGCLELTASLPAILRAASAADAAELLARRDDPVVGAVIDDAARATGRVLAGVLATVNPAVLVIGGSVAALPGFLELAESVARDAAPTWATLDLVVETAHTDHLLGALGAALAASRELPTAVVRKEHRA